MGPKQLKGDDPMRTNKNLLSAAVAVACCVFLVLLCTSIGGREKTYEIRPQISVPEYRTDAARAIDAYERLMERYMDLTEGNLIRIGTDVQDAVRKLDSIDGKLTRLSTRIARIEKALGLRRHKSNAEKSLRPEGDQERIKKKCSPTM
jgi:hypothetical protein